MDPSTGLGFITSHGLHEYDVKTLGSPSCRKLENAIFSPHARSLVYKGWLIRDSFQRILDLLEIILRDEVWSLFRVRVALVSFKG